MFVPAIDLLKDVTSGLRRMLYSTESCVLKLIKVPNGLRKRRTLNYLGLVDVTALKMCIKTYIVWRRNAYDGAMFDFFI